MTSHDPIHLVLCGERGIGKSTIIERVLADTDLVPSGFLTKSLPSKNEDGFHDIFIHRVGTPDSMRIHSEVNRVGHCNGKIHLCYPDVFDALGVEYLTTDIKDVILMDELGFMEQGADRFTDTVLSLFDGDIPILACIKPRTDIEFLNRIRRKEKVEVIPVYERTRDDVYLYVRRRIQEIIASMSL